MFCAFPFVQLKFVKNGDGAGVRVGKGQIAVQCVRMQDFTFDSNKMRNVYTHTHMYEGMFILARNDNGFYF